MQSLLLLLRLIVKNDCPDPGRQQDTIDDATEAAVTRDDHRAGFVDIVGFLGLGLVETRRDQLKKISCLALPIVESTYSSFTGLVHICMDGIRYLLG